MALALVGASAEALYVSRMDLGRMTLIDRDSIRWKDGMPTVTQIEFRGTPFPKGDGRYIREDITLYEYDCKAPRYRTRGWSHRTFTGEIIDQSDYVSDWTNVVPDSYGFHDRELVCFNRDRLDENGEGSAFTGTLNAARDRYYEWLGGELYRIQEERDAKVASEHAARTK